MANIDVEKKNEKNVPIWPWVLGMVLLAGIIWAISSIETNTVENEVVIVEEIETEEVVERTTLDSDLYAEGSFVAYINDRNIKEMVGLDHKVTAEALSRLATSLGVLSEEYTELAPQIHKIKEIAEEIRSDPESLQHADHVAKAFVLAADVMGKIQEERFPSAYLLVEEVQKAADNLQEDEQMLNQKKAVDDFFEKASVAVEKMRDEILI